MKIKNGFTLIELLAVIVILAIIALIATPIVLNIISDSKESSELRSADFYLDAVELAVAQATLKGQNITDGTYNISKDGNICLETYDPTTKLCTDGADSDLDINELVVEVKGKKPEKGTITIINGQIGDVSLTLDNKVIEKDNKGELAYMTQLSEACELKDDVEPIGISVGDKYSCNLGDGERFFYVLEVGTTPISNSTLKENDIALILNGNYDTTTQRWCVSGSDNSCNADGLTGKLDEIGSAWAKVSREQIVLPSAEQVATADGKVYTAFPWLDQTWLYQWEGKDNYGDSPPSGYWTSSPRADLSANAWFVHYGGNVRSVNVDRANQCGVRPVINLKL